MRVPRAGGWLVVPAALGLLAPLPLRADEPPSSSRSNPPPAQAALVRDVALRLGGLLSGTVLDAAGQPVPGCAVTLQQGDAIVAHSETTEAGQFQVAGLRGGVYRISASGGLTACRLWTADSAPPGATNEVLLVAVPDVVRGQSHFGDFLRSDAFLIGAIVAGAIAIPIAIHNARRDAVSGS